MDMCVCSCECVCVCVCVLCVCAFGSRQELAMQLKLLNTSDVDSVRCEVRIHGQKKQGLLKGSLLKAEAVGSKGRESSGGLLKGSHACQKGRRLKIAGRCSQ